MHFIDSSWIALNFRWLDESIGLIKHTTTLDEMTLKIGFIGCGKMAQALAKGFIAAGENPRDSACPRLQFTIFSPHFPIPISLFPKESPNQPTSSEAHPDPTRCLSRISQYLINQCSYQRGNWISNLISHFRQSAALQPMKMCK